MAKTSHSKGLFAEFKARSYLRSKGCRILEKRFKTPVGEIDLVVLDGKALVFVEVKLRKTKEAAAEAIDKKNQMRVRNAAELYLQQHPEYNDCEMRFDALILAPGAWPEHIPDAF
ncbi:MAG: YraN family protein [Alphaproteobacteria bacterium]|nr:YraN family protein [Alphaproteobacteria bacterium]MDE2336942.1 YraN family protein [Alphaproteobacteria bacterium]